MSVPRKLRCRVERLVDHGDRVYTVYLVPDNRVPQFRPGQFLHLALDQYDPSGFWPESRVFSIASSPCHRETLRISYSVKGAFTGRMERELQEGGSLWVKLPYGDFVIEDTSDIVLIAGGTGITAFMAFLEDAPADFRHRITLGYGARAGRLLLYRDVIEDKARSLSQFRCLYFIEQGGVPPLSPGELQGRISAEAVWKTVRDPEAAVWYLSGPPLMLKAISRDLGALGVAAGSIRIDAWE